MTHSIENKTLERAWGRVSFLSNSYLPTWYLTTKNKYCTEWQNRTDYTWHHCHVMRMCVAMVPVEKLYMCASRSSYGSHPPYVHIGQHTNIILHNTPDSLWMLIMDYATHTVRICKHLTQYPLCYRKTLAVHAILSVLTCIVQICTCMSSDITQDAWSSGHWWPPFNIWLPYTLVYTKLWWLLGDYKQISIVYPHAHACSMYLHMYIHVCMCTWPYIPQAYYSNIVCV